MKNPPVAFFDYETRSPVDLEEEGGARYAAHPETTAICLALWFPDGTKGVWANPELCAAFPELLAQNEALAAKWNAWVEAGGPVVAWNASFDRHIARTVNPRFGLAVPKLTQTLDAMVQAQSYALPGQLGKAADTLKVPIRKDTRGKALIKKLSDASKPWAPKLEDLRAFFEYALDDVGAMREVWMRCRPWSAAEWTDYHVVEMENDLGMRLDVDFARAASSFMAEEITSLNSRLQALTGDPGMTLSSHARKAAWLSEQTQDSPLHESCYVTRFKKGQMTKGISAAKEVQAKLRERILGLEERDNLDEAMVDRVNAFLDILEEGNGVASKKYDKIVKIEVEGRVHGQYRCGPTQTGRHTSKGVQFDNIVRDKLRGEGDPALDAKRLIVEGFETGRPRAEIIADVEGRFGLPLQKILARLIRPSIIAPEGESLVWGDWSAIEGRVLPWLAYAENALAPYRRGDCKYSINAALTFGGNWRDIYAGYKADDPECIYKRQVGKVEELALGFGGGRRAFKNMGVNYGVHVTEARAEELKCIWREANTWAVRFWADLNDAAWAAMSSGGAPIRAGRVSYRRVGNDLWCVLPCGRPLVYPEVRAETKYKEAWDKVVRVLTYRKIWQGKVVRGELYGGILAENATQGSAASLLRNLMLRLTKRGCRLIGTTHDEVRIESSDPEADARMLKTEMETNPGWAEGLPLKAEVAYATYYGK